MQSALGLISEIKRQKKEYEVKSKALFKKMVVDTTQ